MDVIEMRMYNVQVDDFAHWTIWRTHVETILLAVDELEDVDVDDVVCWGQCHGCPGA
jgi:hypothetical protein